MGTHPTLSHSSHLDSQDSQALDSGLATEQSCHHAEPKLFSWHYRSPEEPISANEEEITGNGRRKARDAHLRWSARLLRVSKLYTHREFLHEHQLLRMREDYLYASTSLADSKFPSRRLSFFSTSSCTATTTYPLNQATWLDKNDSYKYHTAL